MSCTRGSRHQGRIIASKAVRVSCLLLSSRASPGREVALSTAVRGVTLQRSESRVTGPNTKFVYLSRPLSNFSIASGTART